MGTWSVQNVTKTNLGIFQVVVQAPGEPATDISFLRGVPVQVQSYSFADPFGPATAVLSLPQVSIFDDVGSSNSELSFLRPFADVTIYLVNLTTADPSYQDVVTANQNRQVVWEGFIASMEWQSDDNGSSLSVQCQGAMFQVDKYVQKPFYPPRPWAYENLIALCFNHVVRPNLRTAQMKVEWPAGWSKVMQAPSASTPSYMQPVGVTPGQKITGFFGRNTGGWEKSLTGYIQSLLNVMYDDSGQQWSLRLDTGRQPVLYVRQMYGVTPKYVVYAGQPGVTLSLSRDFTEFANVIYGEGTDAAGVEYNRQVVSNDGAYTDYEPMAYDEEVWPHTDNSRFNIHKMTVEANIKYDNGFDERQAIASAWKTLKRDMDPGLAGSLSLKVSPSGGPKELIRAGETIQVLFAVGSGTQGVIFNIAEADHNVADGSVELKIDSKFRDLLTLEEVLVRTRDPLTPVKLLQVNKRTLMVQDQLAPWNYAKGSGYMPLSSMNFYKNIPAGERFPFTTHSKAFPPKKYPSYYIKCHANAKTRYGRWTTFPIRMGEKGDIRALQFACYDKDGNVLAIPFHLSLYYHTVTADDMPYDGLGPSPFITNAFESTNQYGQPIPSGTPGVTTLPDPDMVEGWGNGPQPAGYSPGYKSAGDPVTGVLMDETNWSWDVTGKNMDFDPNPKSGRESETAITIYGIVYAEYHDYVYFRGRIFRKEPGI